MHAVLPVALVAPRLCALGLVLVALSVLAGAGFLPHPASHAGAVQCHAAVRASHTIVLLAGTRNNALLDPVDIWQPLELHTSSYYFVIRAHFPMYKRVSKPSM